jgi:hypothetical protein
MVGMVLRHRHKNHTVIGYKSCKINERILRELKLGKNLKHKAKWTQYADRMQRDKTSQNIKQLKTRCIKKQRMTLTETCGQLRLE